MMMSDHPSLAGNNPNRISIDESAPRNIPTFKEWSIYNGAQFIDLDFAVENTLTTTTTNVNTPNGNESFDLELNRENIYCITNEDVPMGNPIMFIPSNMFLTSYDAREEFIEYAGSSADPNQMGPLDKAEELLGKLISDGNWSGGGALGSFGTLGAWDATPDKLSSQLQDQISLFYLFVKVLLEYQRGVDSPYYYYLDGLPRVYDNGASLTPACYDCLPPLASMLAMAERVKYINFHQALKTVEFIEDDIKNSGEVTKWAFNVVSTRSLQTDGNERILIPMVDMLNHGTDYEAQVNYDEDGNCLVYTTSDVPAGSPLRISYGDPTNPSALFATYGFLDDTSPATFCKIMHIRPSSELRDIGLDYSRMLFYKETGDVAPEVFNVLLYEILSTNKQAQQEFYQACMNGDYDTQNYYHNEYYAQTMGALKDHVDTFLEQLDELTEKASRKDPRQHPRIPLILSHNNFVRETFLKVKEQIDPIAAQVAIV